MFHRIFQKTDAKRLAIWRNDKNRQTRKGSN